jgi:GNAT superfamily N-acetyltransferase
LQAIRRFVDADHAAVRALFVRVNRELAPAHLTDAFERYIARSLLEEIDRIPAYYGERRGSFWVATAQSGIIGMFGLEQADQATAELRRMYVNPDARRHGVGRNMLAFAEDVARRNACRLMVLSTSELQPAAISLYRNCGYRLLREETAAEQSNKTLGEGIRRFYFEKEL